MAIPKPKHLKRHTQIAWLLVKHARSDLVQGAGLDEVVADSHAGREMAAEAPWSVSRERTVIVPLAVRKRSV